MVKRIGNWYSVELNNVIYNVFIQKDLNTIKCDPTSIIVFDENLNKVDDFTKWNEIERIMEEMDWKYDMIG